MIFTEFQEAVILALVRLAESRERSTGDHVERTSALCELMAELLWREGTYKEIIDKDYCKTICLVSPLHDIGKVGIPDAILLKPGKLTEDEFDIMKTHVDIGLMTLDGLQATIPDSDILNMGIDVIQYHHEKWDGTGYPQGLKGEEIPLSGRIMALVDVYEALRSERVYKRPYSHEVSCDIIADGRGTHFEPLLVDVFSQNHKFFEEVYNEKAFSSL